jgi:hypothetical protein
MNKNSFKAAGRAVSSTSEAEKTKASAREAFEVEH